MNLYKQPPPAPRQPGQPWTLPEAARFLRCSVDLLRKAKKDGRLRTIALGVRVLVPDEEVQRVAKGGLVAA